MRNSTENPCLEFKEEHGGFTIIRNLNKEGSVEFLEDRSRKWLSLRNKLKLAMDENIEITETETSFTVKLKTKSFLGCKGVLNAYSVVSESRKNFFMDAKCTENFHKTYVSDREITEFLRDKFLIPANENILNYNKAHLKALDRYNCFISYFNEGYILPNADLTNHFDYY